MAKSFISPGVFTNEIDASFLGAGVGAIGAAIIGTAPKGPAFVPVTLASFDEFIPVFGDLDPDHMLTYGARAYLRNSSTANIVRVLGPAGRSFNGVTVTPGYAAEQIQAITSFTGSTAAIMALLEVTGSGDLIVTDLVGNEFFVEITGSGVDFTIPRVTASFLTSSDNYIAKVLNTDPTAFADKGYYVRDIYEYAYKTHSIGNAEYSSASFGGMTDFQRGFNSGSTPWLKSQLFGGSVEYNMFRVHTLGHGEAENGRFKISVANIRPASNPSVNPFGKFDLEVRSFADGDGGRAGGGSKILVESFPNLTMDPADPNYICRVVGDHVMTYDVSQEKIVQSGDYENRSNVIRVELATGSFPDSAVPWGFRGLSKAGLTVSGSVDGILDLPLVADLLDKPGQAEAKNSLYWGMETVLSGNVSARFTHYPTMTGSDADFTLSNVSGSTLDNLKYNASNPSDSLKSPGESLSHTALDSVHAKFTVPIAFGFDGFDRRLANPLSNATELLAGSQIGVQALRQAVDVISDPDFIDINLLGIPGIVSSKVVDYGIDAIEDRADAFYIIDVTGSTKTAVVQEVRGRGFDSSYAGVYYPGIKVYDDVNNVAVSVPASVPVLGVMAYNDRVAFPWFAPAGLNRAGLSRDSIGFDVTSINDQLKQTERDDLYENRINAIARFPSVPQGVIWGQKTLQLKASALDRINVRRLLIRTKKLVSSATKYLVFEQNDGVTQTRFRQMVNPILADIQQKQGLEKFLVIMDETTNTPELRDRNIMAGKIFLVPTKAAEFISVDFVISPSGASFDEG